MSLTNRLCVCTQCVSGGDKFDDNLLYCEWGMAKERPKNSKIVSSHLVCARKSLKLNHCHDEWCSGRRQLRYAHSMHKNDLWFFRTIYAPAEWSICLGKMSTKRPRESAKLIERKIEFHSSLVHWNDSLLRKTLRNVNRVERSECESGGGNDAL